MGINYQTSVKVNGQGTVEIDFSGLPDDVIHYVLERGLGAVSNSARAGKQGEEADQHQYHRLKEISQGIMPKSGGSGPRLTDHEKATRQVIEHLAISKLRIQTTDARKLATADDRLEKLAKPLLKAKGEKQTGDRLAEAVEKLGAQVEEKAQALVAQWQEASDMDI